MAYIKDLQEVCKCIRDLLNSFEFLGHISYRAGRLQETKNLYKAVFMCHQKDEGKTGNLERFIDERIKGKINGVELITGKYAIESEPVEEQKFWMIQLISKGTIPKHQEKSLIRALNIVKNELERYKPK